MPPATLHRARTSPIVIASLAIPDAYVPVPCRRQQTWIYGLVTAVCAHDERIFRVFALFGYIHATKVALQYVEQLAKQLLTKWGTRIMDIYPQHTARRFD